MGGACAFQDCCYFVCCAGRWNVVYPACRGRSRFPSVFEAGRSESHTRLRTNPSRCRAFLPSIPLAPGTADCTGVLPHCSIYQRIGDTQIKQGIARAQDGSRSYRWPTHHRSRLPLTLTDAKKKNATPSCHLSLRGRVARNPMAAHESTIRTIRVKNSRRSNKLEAVSGKSH